ncbi:helix-turn-helix domain-containing protein [Paenibacillus terrae]
MVKLYENGKPRADLVEEYGLTVSAIDRWIKYTGMASIISFSCCLAGIITVQDFHMFFHFYTLFLQFRVSTTNFGVEPKIKRNFSLDIRVLLFFQ